MPGPGNTWLGPLQTGTTLGNSSGQSDIGGVVLQQDVTLVHNGTNTVDGTILLPGGAQILDIVCDTTTAWTSATSDTLSVGLTSGGTDYASGIDVKAGAARIRPTYTTTQLTNMLAIPTTSPQVVIHCTVTPVGSAAAGQTTVSIHYQQTVQLSLGSW